MRDSIPKILLKGTLVPIVIPVNNVSPTSPNVAEETQKEISNVAEERQNANKLVVGSTDPSSSELGDGDKNVNGSIGTDLEKRSSPGIVKSIVDNWAKNDNVFSFAALAEAKVLADRAVKANEAKAKALADKALADKAKAEADAKALADKAKAEADAKALADKAKAEADAKALADKALADKAKADAYAEMLANAEKMEEDVRAKERELMESEENAKALTEADASTQKILETPDEVDNPIQEKKIEISNIQIFIRPYTYRVIMMDEAKKRFVLSESNVNMDRSKPELEYGKMYSHILFVDVSVAPITIEYLFQVKINDDAIDLVSYPTLDMMNIPPFVEDNPESMQDYNVAIRHNNILLSPEDMDDIRGFTDSVAQPLSNQSANSGETSYENRMKMAGVKKVNVNDICDNSSMRDIMKERFKSQRPTVSRPESRICAEYIAKFTEQITEFIKYFNDEV